MDDYNRSGHDLYYETEFGYLDDEYDKESQNFSSYCPECGNNVYFMNAGFLCPNCGYSSETVYS